MAAGASGPTEFTGETPVPPSAGGDTDKMQSWPERPHFLRASVARKFYVASMMIWLLALVLLASLAGLGYRQGAIRVACSLAGIIAGLLLAAPLAKLAKVQAGLVAVGVHNPILLWLLPPPIVFVVVLVIFKIVGAVVHRKVALHYKYKSGDLRLARWERMHQRLGLCLGLVNATVYLALICTVIYMFSYWTVQLATSDQDPKSLKILNRLGRDVQSSGMSRVAGALDFMPPVYYQAADLANIIYHTPLIEARLSRYPGFFALGERPEFQALAKDNGFSNLRLSVGNRSVMDLIKYPAIKTMLNNPDMLKLIWKTAAPDLQDLRNFLETGRSAKYDGEKILGRWDYDVNSAIALVGKTEPNITSRQMQEKRLDIARLSKAVLVAAPGGQVFIKNAPPLNTGSWRKTSGGQYEFRLGGGGGRERSEIDDDHLTLLNETAPLVFKRED
jgi:hypothetical protein